MASDLPGGASPTMSDGSFMRRTDAFAWYMEDDPELRSTVVGVAWLDELPPWDDLAARLERATRLAPGFRQRLVEPPRWVGSPRWTTDPQFDLSWHLRRVAAPEPRTPETVLELASTAAMAAFDRTRPLWEFTLVEGLSNDRAALVMKMHHSLTDGIGGVQLASLLFDDRPDRRIEGPMPDAPRGETHRGLELVGLVIADHAGRLCRGVLGALRRAPANAARVLSHPLGTGGELAGTARSIGRTVRPVTSVLSPIMTRRGPGRRLHMITLGLKDMRRAGAAAGGTVNDAFMAGIAGGLRIYHLRHGASVTELLVTLPISVRGPDDPPGGNRITLQRFRVPVGVEEPVERVRAIHRCCRAARTERSLPYTDAIAGALNVLPSGVLGSILKRVDFLASDVAGFPGPTYLCGAHLSGYYAFGPTIGSAMNATLFSYGDLCCIGVTVDTAAVPDHEVLAECLGQGFSEVIGTIASGSPRTSGAR